MAEQRVHGVLLVVAEGDPHGLLDLLSVGWACGARPPMTYNTKILRKARPGVWFAGSAGVDHVSTLQRRREIHRAFALAWDGAETLTGLMYLKRCIPDERKTVALGVIPPKGLPESLVECWRVALYAEMIGLGTVVLTDADGREVTYER